MKMLQAALYQKAVEDREAERAELEGTKTKIEWGQQIRSYVLQPYKMVKDHRTNTEIGNVDAVLDGRIDDFIQAFLREAGGRNHMTCPECGCVRLIGLREGLCLDCWYGSEDRPKTSPRSLLKTQPFA